MSGNFNEKCAMIPLVREISVNVAYCSYDIYEFAIYERSFQRNERAVVSFSRRYMVQFRCFVIITQFSIEHCVYDLIALVRESGDMQIYSRTAKDQKPTERTSLKE